MLAGTSSIDGAKRKEREKEREKEIEIGSDSERIGRCGVPYIFQLRECIHTKGNFYINSFVFSLQRQARKKKEKEQLYLFILSQKPHMIVM